MLRYYFSKYGTVIAGKTPRDKDYIHMRQQVCSRSLVREVYTDLGLRGFTVSHNPIDETGHMAFSVAENTAPNLKFLFGVQAECGELMELTGRMAAFHVRCAATCKTAIFYAGTPGQNKTGMTDFMARIVTSWGRKPQP